MLIVFIISIMFFAVHYESKFKLIIIILAFLAKNAMKYNISLLFTNKLSKQISSF